jgi:hypothetical protein
VKEKGRGSYIAAWKETIYGPGQVFGDDTGRLSGFGILH